MDLITVFFICGSIIIISLLLYLYLTKKPLSLDGKLILINEKLNQIMATQKELTDQINALTGVVVKVGGETRTLLTRIEELLAVISAGGEVTPELQSAVNDLQAQVDVVDALVPDAPTEPPAANR